LTSHNVSGAPIPIAVGGQKFYVHAGTLTTTSQFFKNAMKSEWRTIPKKPIDLSEEDPEEFEVYSRWLYSRKIFVDVHAELTHDHLARLYVLGEKLTDEPFQDAVLYTVIDIVKDGTKYPPDEAINIIYSRTSSASSPARRLIVDMYVHAGHKRWLCSESICQATCVEFVDDFVKGFFECSKRLPEKGFPWVKAPEAYIFTAMRVEEHKEKETGKAKDDAMDISAQWLTRKPCLEDTVQSLDKEDLFV
jgi:hypothetical protein